MFTPYNMAIVVVVRKPHFGDKAANLLPKLVKDVKNTLVSYDPRGIVKRRRLCAVAICEVSEPRVRRTN